MKIVTNNTLTYFWSKIKALLAGKADVATTYTKTQVDGFVNGLSGDIDDAKPMLVYLSESSGTYSLNTEVGEIEDWLSADDKNDCKVIWDGDNPNVVTLRLVGWNLERTIGGVTTNGCIVWTTDENGKTITVTAYNDGNDDVVLYNEFTAASNATMNQISSITTTESSTSGGNNVVTISQTNGNSTTFNVKNGESAYQTYYNTTSDNPKKTEAQWLESLKGADGVTLGQVELVQATGSNTDKVMSQDAVTNEIMMDFSCTPTSTYGQTWESGQISSNGSNSSSGNYYRTQGYLDIGESTKKIIITTPAPFNVFLYNNSGTLVANLGSINGSLEVLKTTYPTMRKLRFYCYKDYYTTYYLTHIFVKCFYYELLKSAIKQETGQSEGSLMSQKAITDALAKNIMVQTCACGYLRPGSYYRFNLTERQYNCLTNTDIVSLKMVMTEPENAYNGSTSMTLRYVGLWFKHVTSSGSRTDCFNFIWDYSKRMFCAGKNYNTTTCVNKTSGGTIINPLVFTIVWDKANGTIKYYERNNLISTQTDDVYKVSSFVGSEKTITIFGGDTGIFLYDMQIFDYDISKKDFAVYERTIYGASYVYAKYDGNLRSAYTNWTTTDGSYSTYGTATGFTTTFPGDGTAVITSSGSNTYLNRGYYLGSSSVLQRWEADITVESGSCKITTNGQVIETIVDGNGNEYADGSTLGVGTYTIKGVSGGTGCWRIYYVSGDPMKVIHTANRFKYISCVAHLKCDNFYNGALYDEQERIFYETNTNLKPNGTPFTLPRTTTNNPPNYAGQMAVPSGNNIYIGTSSYTWKQINNS